MTMSLALRGAVEEGMFRKRGFWLALLLVVAAAAGGGYYWTTTQAAQPASAEAGLNTTTARRGDLMLSVLGSGTLQSAQDVGLSFGVSGVLTEVSVELGDLVAAGDILARIDDLDAQHAVMAAEVQVASAIANLDAQKQSHAELFTGPSEAELLNAEAAVLAAEEALATLEAGASEADLASARATLAAARQAYSDLVNGPSAEALRKAELDLDRARNSLWAAQLSRDARGGERDIASGSYDQAQASVLNAEISVQLAEMALEELKKPASQIEIADALAKVRRAEETLAAIEAGPSAAELANARARVAQAREALVRLQTGATAGEIALSETKIRQAELNVTQAELTLETAQKNLGETTLTAPFNATVTQVNAQVGQLFNSNSNQTLFVLSDLQEPILEVFIDQSDRDMVAVDHAVEVVFDARPNLTLTGRVLRVDPSLVREGQVMVIRALVALDSYEGAEGLLAGSSATVEIIAGKAENAVLVPLEALQHLGGGEYAVFVVENGEPRMRPVEIGLQDLIFAEVRSGLQPGERVTTGMMETRR